MSVSQGYRVGNRQRRRLLTAVGVFLIVATACRGDAPDDTSTVALSNVSTTTTRTESTTTTAPAPTTTTVVASTTTTLPPLPPLPDELAAQIEELITVTELLRGLEFLEAPMIEVASAEEVSTRRRTSLQEDLDAEALVSEAAFYELFDILPAGTDLYAFYTDFYSAGTLAYYDLEEHRLVVPLSGDRLNEYEKWILVHELTHALMDQHYPEVADAYEASSDGGNFDQTGALLGLLEGEAVFIQSLYLERLDATARAEVVRLANERSNPTYGDAPFFFRELIRFPYTAGSLLAVDLYRRGGVEALNQAFDRPPTTTEQVLHPQRYVELQLATALAVDTVALDGYETTEEGSWGERGWRILLDHHLGSSTSAQAADGWGGDHYQILWSEEASEVAFVVTYIGDSFGDASELAGAIGLFVETAMAVGSGTVTETSIEWEGDSYAYLARQGDQLMFVAASDPEVGRALVELLDS